MRTVWKYPITDGQVHLVTPPRAKLLTVAEARGQLAVWYEVDPAFDGAEDHLLWAVPTGGEVPNLSRYIDTVVDHRGYVWHVYEALTPQLAARMLERTRPV